MALREVHAEVRAESVRRAGGPDDLVLRATTYVELYRHSGGNHGFPLLAAHGALWGAGHFRRGRIIGRLLTRAAGLDRAERQVQMQRIEAFASALKEINRQVCVETYTAYHLTRLFGDDPELAAVIPKCLIASLTRCHAARRRGQRLTRAERQDLFEAFFLWEQATIVGPSVDAAVAQLDWPLLRALSLRPPIGFAYFRPGKWLWFRSFDDTEERLRRGREAFELAERCGWDHVESSLDCYRLLPNRQSGRHRVCWRSCP